MFAHCLRTATDNLLVWKEKEGFPYPSTSLRHLHGPYGHPRPQVLLVPFTEEENEGLGDLASGSQPLSEQDSDSHSLPNRFTHLLGEKGQGYRHLHINDRAFQLGGRDTHSMGS